MTGDKKLRMVAWACFILMWIPLAVFILHVSSGAATESDGIWMLAFFALLFTFVILLTVSCFGPLATGWRESRIVRQQGTLVPAEIMSVADTGIYINRQPMLEFMLLVHPPHEAAFEAMIREVVPLSAIPQVQPGSRLQVYYIPGTTRIAFPE
jgi:hypothetical protein